MGMRDIYRKIAKKNGVTVAEVKREMQVAITAAYTDSSNNNAVTLAYQNRVPRVGKIPTPEELIRYAAQTVQKEQ